MAIIFWLILCFFVALLGNNRNIGYGWGLFFCIIFSPIIGLIIILCSKKKGPDFVEMNKNTTK